MNNPSQYCIECTAKLEPYRTQLDHKDDSNIRCWICHNCKVIYYFHIDNPYLDAQKPRKWFVSKKNSTYKYYGSIDILLLLSALDKPAP